MLDIDHLDSFPLVLAVAAVVGIVLAVCRWIFRSGAVMLRGVLVLAFLFVSAVFVVKLVHFVGVLAGVWS